MSELRERVIDALTKHVYANGLPATRDEFAPVADAVLAAVAETFDRETLRRQIAREISEEYREPKRKPGVGGLYLRIADRVCDLLAEKGVTTADVEGVAA